MKYSYDKKPMNIHEFRLHMIYEDEAEEENDYLAIFTPAVKFIYGFLILLILLVTNYFISEMFFNAILRYTIGKILVFLVCVVLAHIIGYVFYWVIYNARRMLGDGKKR